MTWKAMIVDDEPYVREDLREMLSAHPGIDVAYEAGTIAQARKHLIDHRPDLIFLDIQLRGGTGFDLVPAIAPETKIIFITAYDRYAVRAFRINALDYILKPVTPERLAEAIRRLNPDDASEPRPSCPGPPCPDDKVFHQIRHRPDFRAGPYHHGGQFHRRQLHGRCHHFRRKPGLPETIKEWLDILPEELFVRIHRSTLVNIRHVDRFEAPKRGTGLVFMAGRSDPLAVSVRMAATLKKRTVGVGPVGKPPIEDQRVEGLTEIPCRLIPHSAPPKQHVHHRFAHVRHNPVVRMRPPSLNSGG